MRRLKVNEACPLGTWRWYTSSATFTAGSNYTLRGIRVFVIGDPDIPIKQYILDTETSFTASGQLLDLRVHLDTLLPHAHQRDDHDHENWTL